MTDGKTLIDLELNVSRYLRNAAAAATAARKTDAALSDMSDEARAASDALDEVSGDVTVKIRVSDSALSAATADVTALDRTVSVVINTTGEDVLTNAKADVDAIDAADPQVRINTTGEQALKDAKSDLTDIDSTDPNVKINVKGNTDLDEIKRQLETIKQLAVIDFVLKGVGAARNTIAQIADLPIVATVADLDEAVRKFESAGGALTDATRGAINDEFTRGLAESPQQVAETAAQLDKAGQGGERLSASLEGVYNYALLTQTPIEEATRAALALVAAGQATDTATAADLLADGYRRGADRAQDMLDVVGEFSSTFKAVGVNGAQQMALINAGLVAGARNGSVVADTFKGLGETLRASLTTGAGDAGFDALESLGLTDMAADVAQGKESGAQLAMSIVDGVKEQIESGAITPIDGNQMIASIFGGSIDELGIDVFKNIDFASVLAAEFNPDAVETAIAPLRGGLVAAATELGRVLESEIADKFRIAGQPLQDLLDSAPQKLRDIAELIRGGAGIPESLEIVLKAQGLADTIHDFESGFSNAIIELLNGLAQLVALIPGANPAPLQNTVANLSAGQLSFDLINSDNEAEVTAAIQRAVDRGVTDSQLSEAVATATGELVEKGQTISADTLIGRIKAGMDSLTRAGENGTNPISSAALSLFGMPDLDAVLNIANANQTMAFDVSGAEALLDAAKNMPPAAEEVTDAVETSTTVIDGMKVSIDALEPAISKAGDTASTFGDDMGISAEDIARLSTATGTDSVNALGNLAEAYRTQSPVIRGFLMDYIEDYEALTFAANTATDAMGFKPTMPEPTSAPGAPVQGFAEGGRPPAYEDVMVGENGRELATFAAGATVINNANTEALLGALASFMSGGGGGSSQSVYNNVSVIINAGNEASAYRAGAGVETSLRGFQL